VVLDVRPVAPPKRPAGRLRRGAALGMPVALLAVAVAAWALIAHSISGPPTVPAAYRTTVLTAAATCPGLDPRVLAAQIARESKWDAQATSAKGAEGIAQFLPRIWTAYGVDGDGDGVKDVWNPRDAIPSAARFDCVLMRQVTGVPGDKVRNMLAAYNAGPDKVRQYGGVPPFAETRAYVQQVMDTARVIVLSPGS
jgi:soluble lytic murein transglycosylase-like protein